MKEAIQHSLDQPQHEQLTKAMEEGYQAEAESPSMDREWSNAELDDWS